VALCAILANAVFDLQTTLGSAVDWISWCHCQ